jgi:hypothetical protein
MEWCLTVHRYRDKEVVGGVFVRFSCRFIDSTVEIN